MANPDSFPIRSGGISARALSAAMLLAAVAGFFAAAMSPRAALAEPPAKEPPVKKKVLFLCTGNSCRSQMAEGWTRHLLGDRIEAYSAGIETKGLNPHAVKVMREAGVDITGQSSKLASTLQGVKFDLVVTVCSHADEHCPAFLGKARVVHHGFDDPPKLALAAKSEAEALAHYVRVRDEIRKFIERELPPLLDSPK